MGQRKYGPGQSDRSKRLGPTLIQNDDVARAWGQRLRKARLGHRYESSVLYKRQASAASAIRPKQSSSEFQWRCVVL